ncbi:MAG TPA: imelysin family protein, partial [Chryseosolibacter sp.]|nr:imelysin family protein [Chryseosolibacter sp.]
MRAILLFFLVTVLFFFSGCGNQGDPSPADNSKDRKEILTHWADNIIVPSYQQFKAKLDLMVTASEAFTTAPTETSLNEFRSAWLDAYTGW